jgi:hypothetical protein
MVGQAFAFDGSSQYVDVPSNAALSPTLSISVEAWIYPRVPLNAPSSPVIKKAGEGSAQEDGYALEVISTGEAKFAVYFGGFKGWVASAPAPVPTEQWSHVAGVYDGTNVLIYVNGAAVGAPTAATGQIVTSGNNLQIGHDPSNSSWYFNGLIDEASLYARALSAGEVQAIYNAGSLGKCFGQLPPVILVQPQSRTANVGGPAAFRVQVGCDVYAYQWRFNGTDLAGATDSSLVITNVQAANAGDYSVTVSNAAGSVTSSTAVLTVNSAPLCIASPANLISRWSGDGAANDSAGTNNGFLQGGAGFAQGKVSDAFSFDGVSGLVRVPDATNLNFGSTSSLTVEFWAYRTGTQAVMHIFGKRASNCGSYEYQMAMDPGNGGLQFGGSAFTGVKTGLQLPTNTWIHLAATFDGATFRFYTNGALAATGTGTLGPTNDAPLMIGGSSSCPPFAGLLDEVCLYNRALSASEIQSIYLAGSAGKCYGPTPPAFFSQPQSQTVIQGQNASFSALAGGSAPLSYQWRFNGANLSGATNSALTLTNVQTGNAGSYSVRVTNSLGSITSSNAVLTVSPLVCAPGGSNLVGWWAGEGNANDNIGGNNGTFQGVESFAAGKVGQALSFNGTNQYVDVPNSASLNPIGSISLEAWIFPRSPLNSVSAPVIKKAGEGPGQTDGYMLEFAGSDGIRFIVYVSGGAGYVVSPTAPVGLSQWSHVVGTYDGTNASIYVNGVVVGATVGAGQIVPSGNNLQIGHDPSNPSRYFNGLIDEASVYNTALSTAQVQAIYNAGPSGKCPLPPSFTTQPQGQTVQAGTNVTFAPRTMGSQPLGYQWRFDGATLTGATSASLTLTNVQPSDAGLYSVRISNVLGSATSSDALLKVIVVTAFANGQLLTNSQYSFGSSATIQLRNVYTNGDVFYTLNGSAPTFQSTLYTGSFTISNNVILRALGYSADFFEYGELDPIAISIVPNYTLSVSTPGGGTVSVSPTNTLYPSGSVVTLTATPATGWAFLQWLGDAAGTNPTNSVVMTRNKSAQALFGTTLSTTAAGGGSVVLNPTGGLYPYGTIVQVSAIPQPGKFFGLWGNAASGNLNPLNFLVTNANPTVSSLFAALNSNQVALAVIPIGHGQISLSPRSNAYAIGQNVTITATADAQQSFLGWSGDAAGSQNPLTVAMNQSKTIYANFTKNYRFSFQPLGGLGLSDGFRLNLVGEVGTAYRFEASSNFAAWTPLATLTNYSGTLEYIDAGASGFVRRFYRAVPLP